MVKLSVVLVKLELRFRIVEQDQISGDGNIHLNVTVHEFTQEVYRLIEPYIFEETSKLKGSVSAEHGIGFKKPKFLGYSKTKEAIALMKQMKEMMDPNGILNPYKVLPP